MKAHPGPFILRGGCMAVGRMGSAIHAPLLCTQRILQGVCLSYLACCPTSRSSGEALEAGGGLQSREGLGTCQLASPIKMQSARMSHQEDSSLAAYRSVCLSINLPIYLSIYLPVSDHTSVAALLVSPA